MQDRSSKATFDPAFKLHAKVKAQAMAPGLLCYPTGGTIDGPHGDPVPPAPPFISSEPDLDQVVEHPVAAIVP